MLSKVTSQGIFVFTCCRIGFAIARRLAQDGAKVMLSSRKQQNVDKAVKELTAENLNVAGIVCHVAKKEDRQRLFQEVLDLFHVLKMNMKDIVN